MLGRYVVKRLVVLVPVLLGVTIITFSLVNFLPGGPVEFMVRLQPGADEELVQRIRAQYNLDEPIWKRYLIWLWNILHADLGRSIISDQNVAAAIANRLPLSLYLGIYAMLISLVISFTAGIISAVKKGTSADEAARIFALVGISIPNFWLGLILILVFAVELGWFSVIPPDDRTWVDTVKFLFLPAITLGTAGAALLTRMIRSSMLEVMNKDFVRTTRAFGLPERTVIFKHVLRNALIPVVTLIGLQVAFMVNGTVVIEEVFAWPGMGRLLINAIDARDFRMIQGITLIVAISIVFINLVVDIVYAFIDPRIRY